jgi:hypothetical protein
MLYRIVKKKIVFFVSCVLAITILASTSFASDVTENAGTSQVQSETKTSEKIYEIGGNKVVGGYIYEYFNNLYKIMQNGEINKYRTSNLDTNSYIIIKDLEYKSNFYKVFHGGIQDLSLDQFIIKEVTETNEYFNVIVYINVSYIFNKNEKNSIGSLYKVKLKKGDSYQVISIDTTSIDNQITKDTLKIKFKSNKTKTEVSSSGISQEVVNNSDELKVIDAIFESKNKSLESE